MISLNCIQIQKGFVLHFQTKMNENITFFYKNFSPQVILQTANSFFFLSYNIYVCPIHLCCCSTFVKAKPTVRCAKIKKENALFEKYEDVDALYSVYRAEYQAGGFTSLLMMQLMSAGCWGFPIGIL